MLGNRIHEARKALGLTMKQFADMLGVSQSSLSAVENNKSKPLSTLLEDIVQKTNISPRWLLTGEGEMRYNPSSSSHGEFLENTAFIDYELLKSIIEGLEDFIKEKNLHITSAKKSKVIIDMYKYCMLDETDHISAEKFNKLLRMN